MWWRTGFFAVIVALVAAPAGASTFTLETSAFLNGGGMPSTDAAATGSCGGRNLSPPLHFSGFSAAVRSLGVVAYDTDAHFVHWVAYGIAPVVTNLPPGFGSTASPLFVGGLNDAGTALYWGPCPPNGDPPHHYVFTAYALDLTPARLPPGLSRAAFLRGIAKHTLAQAQITGLFAR